MSGREHKGFDFNAGGEPSLEEVADEIYGTPREALDTGRLVARPIPLELIHPDLRQPRRAVPPTVRGQWTGDPDEIPAVLTSWWQAAGAENISDFLSRAVEAPEDAYVADADPVRDGWRELLGLAASIRIEGLQNPITAVKRNGGYLVETGERRLLAYHVLRIHVDARKYNAIPAIVKDEADVWGQAAENGARRPLNAISMARQLALLIMDLYGDFADTFGKFEDVVLPGECDRAYYAQVADGNKWRIPDGMTQRILDVTGLKSKSQVSQYRAILKVSDPIWTQADAEDWAEWTIRSKQAEVDREAARKAEQERLTVGDLLSTTDDQGAEGAKSQAEPTSTSGADRVEAAVDQSNSAADDEEEMTPAEMAAWIDEMVGDPDSYPHEGYQEETTPVVANYPAAAAILNQMEIVRGMIDGGNAPLFEAIEALSSWTEDDVRLLVAEKGAPAVNDILGNFDITIRAGLDQEMNQLLQLFWGLVRCSEELTKFVQDNLKMQGE